MSNSIDDLLNELEEPKQEYDEVVLPPAEEQTEGPSEPPAEEQIEIDSIAQRTAGMAMSKFVVNNMDRLLNVGLCLVAGDEDADFSATEDERAEMQSIVYQMVKGKQNLPPWAQFTISVVSIYGFKLNDALMLRKKNKQIEEQQKLIREQQLQIELMKAKTQADAASEPSQAEFEPKVE